MGLDVNARLARRDDAVRIERHLQLPVQRALCGTVALRCEFHECSVRTVDAVAQLCVFDHGFLEACIGALCFFRVVSVEDKIDDVLRGVRVQHKAADVLETMFAEDVPGKPIRTENIRLTRRHNGREPRLARAGPVVQQTEFVIVQYTCALPLCMLGPGVAIEGRAADERRSRGLQHLLCARELGRYLLFGAVHIRV